MGRRASVKRASRDPQHPRGPEHSPREAVSHIVSPYARTTTPGRCTSRLLTRTLLTPVLTTALALLVEHDADPFDADPFEVKLYELATDPRTLLSTAPSDAAQSSTSGTSVG
jgi:hypothetical protein